MPNMARLHFEGPEPHGPRLVRSVYVNEELTPEKKRLLFGLLQKTLSCALSFLS
jgi:hypothetical protein